ncbi:hypothetical protein [Bacillus sp. RAR_GA_16]|uniref:hypothetical protein n=1 Tax=Bacillus sp. RAR_GA_16 TaxID=2876774 RepID=UPI001CCD297C|nr:hypothetical protein [Bacillus sp. RAR_GA_16]MCA0174522.1 hypothetical protein [Bacillus sp. RAR_GA_16]
MNCFLWGNTPFTFTTEETRTLNVLLPYWGLRSQQDEAIILPALTDCSAGVSGLDSASFKDLIKSLQHTGVSLSTDVKENGKDVNFHILFDEKLSYPVSLTLLNMTYNLRPSGSYRELKTVIHDQIWTPTDYTSITVRIHPKSKINTVRWMNYLIIQNFLRKTFQPLDGISLSTYRRFVDQLLLTINPDFAKLQLYYALNEWPDLPKVPSHLNETILPIQKDSGSLSPFSNQSQNQETTTFNPFKFQTKSKNTKMINPFQNKH